MQDEDKINNNLDTEINDEPIEELVELGDDGEELASDSQVKKLKDKIKKLEETKAEYILNWQRALADYKNREMQIAKERPEWGAYAVRDFAQELLVVMDTYDAAKSNVSAWEAVDANWRGGIEYIFNTFEDKLKDQGFEKFGAVGDVFDPNIHEGLGTISLDTDISFIKGQETESKNEKDVNLNKENTIAQVIMSGYKYKGKVIRAAKVKVYN